MINDDILRLEPDEFYSRFVIKALNYTQKLKDGEQTEGYGKGISLKNKFELNHLEFRLRCVYLAGLWDKYYPPLPPEPEVVSLTSLKAGDIFPGNTIVFLNTTKRPDFSQGNSGTFTARDPIQSYNNLTIVTDTSPGRNMIEFHVETILGAISISMQTDYDEWPHNPFVVTNYLPQINFKGWVVISNTLPMSRDDVEWGFNYTNILE